MAETIPPLENLIEQFHKLTGIGRKTAARLAFCVLKYSEDDAQAFADAIIAAKREIKQCRQCHNLCVGELCPVCSDANRDASTVCVVEDTRSVMSIEKLQKYNGLYHVLNGELSPMDGILPKDLTINDLIERVKGGSIAEVIIATNSTCNGEATAMYLKRVLAPYSNVKVTRLAYGIPVGGEIEYADGTTLFRAIEGRREM